MSYQVSNQIPQKYSCIICFDWCKKAISCNRCSKLLCQQHTWALGDRCPHCRLTPFNYAIQQQTQNQIDIVLRQEKKRMKKQNVFKCLVDGCNFQGRYNQMEYHRKSRHFYEKIDEILFPEERKNKLKRDALKRLFIDKQIEENQKYKKRAMPIYVKSRGIFEIGSLTKMMAHIDKCNYEQCKQIVFDERCAYIGITKKDEGEVRSNCPIALLCKQSI